MPCTPEDGVRARDADGVDLWAQCDVVNGASLIAWQALIDAYRPLPSEHEMPVAELLIRYRNANALRIAAERTLLERIGGRHDALALAGLYRAR